MRRMGLTLVEVIVALALLATVVSAVLVAQARSLQQVRSADQRRKAGDLAAALLVQWRLEARPLDAPDQGAFSEAGWSWKREVQRQRIAMSREGGTGSEPEMLVIRLAVLHEQPHGESCEVAAVSWFEPVHGKSP